jgi:hypothetical protein
MVAVRTGLHVVGEEVGAAANRIHVAKKAPQSPRLDAAHSRSAERPKSGAKKTAMRMRRGGPPVTLLHKCIRSVPIGFAAFVLKTVDPTQLQKFWGHEGAHDTDLTEQPVGIDGSSTWPPQVTVLQQAHEAHGLVPPPQAG